MRMKKVFNEPDITILEHGQIDLFQDVRGTLSPERLKEYVKGGRGIVTLENPNTGKYHTYEFRAPNNPDDFAKDVLFVYVLVADNTWLYVGMYTYMNMYFKCTRASKFRYSSEIVKGIIYLVKIIRGTIKEYPMLIYHEGVCSVCGRKLTTPKSIQWGIGPKCRRALELS